MTGIDGRVNNLNQNVFSTLEAIKQRNQGKSTLNATDARQLNEAIKADGIIDAAETDLLRELTQKDLRAINVSQDNSNFSPKSLTFASTTGQAQNILKATLSSASDTELSKLWNGGPQGIAALTQIYSRSPADAERVTTFLAKQVDKAWDESSITNGYGPLRSLIANGFAGVNQLEGDANVQGRWMVHNAIKQVDTKPDGSDGAIPNVLYNWIRPGGLL